MKFDITKDARQELSTEKWRQNYGIGCIDACPRFGKTQIGIKIINKNRERNPYSNILVVVPSEVIQKQWLEQIDTVSVLTSNAAKNFVDNILSNPNSSYNIDVLIVDELHKFTSQDNIKLLRTLASFSRFRLALTGTYPSSVRVLTELFPIIDTVTEKEALEKGWISEYIEYNIPSKFTDEEKIKYTKYSKLISETLNLFKGKARIMNEGTSFFTDDLDLIYSCYTGKRYAVHNKRTKDYLKGGVVRELLAKKMGWDVNLDLSIPHNREREVYWNPNNIYERCKQFKQLVQARTELLNKNSHKLELVKQIIELNPVPTIIFNESIEFVNIIADELGMKAIAYHSKIKSRPLFDNETGEIIKFKTGRVKMFGATYLKNEALEGMTSGRYSVLVTAKALDEGLDLPIIEQVIITAGSANPIQQLQRSARGKTIDSMNKSKFTKIFNLYVDDFRDDFGELIISRDKAKLIERQKSYTHAVTWVGNLSEITL